MVLREHAQKMGLTINEYGCFESPTRSKKIVGGKTEEEVYAKLGLAWVPPELGENRGELEAAAKNRLPRLVEFSDIRGDFHNHSSHPTAAIPGGDGPRRQGPRLGVDRPGRPFPVPESRQRALRGPPAASFKELTEVQAKVKGIRLLRSMEVDILKDGRLDYPDEVLEEIGVVIGSVHSSFGMPERK